MKTHLLQVALESLQILQIVRLLIPVYKKVIIIHTGTGINDSAT
jgi:3-keto-L-gulonate-6-phosphate decarboxylase